MNGNHQSIDFRPHPARTVWLHRTERTGFEETLPQPLDAIREDFMESDAVTAAFDDQAGQPLTLEEAQYIGMVMCFGIGVLAVALCFLGYALWPMLRALW